MDSKASSNPVGIHWISNCNTELINNPLYTGICSPQGMNFNKTLRYIALCVVNFVQKQRPTEKPWRPIWSVAFQMLPQWMMRKWCNEERVPMEESRG